LHVLTGPIDALEETLGSTQLSLANMITPHDKYVSKTRNLPRFACQNRTCGGQVSGRCILAILSKITQLDLAAIPAGLMCDVCDRRPAVGYTYGPSGELDSVIVYCQECGPVGMTLFQQPSYKTA